MPHAGFVHLRVHSAYSLLEGAIKIDDLVARCRRQAMPAVAVTDSGNLFGALEFALAAKGFGVQPIIGCQLAISREDTQPLGGPAGRPAPDSIVLLVQNEAGYRNLMRLVSKAFLDTPAGETAHALVCMPTSPTRSRPSAGSSFRRWSWRPTRTKSIGPRRRGTSPPISTSTSGRRWPRTGRESGRRRDIGR